jgi:hypothetical protein
MHKPTRPGTRTNAHAHTQIVILTAFLQQQWFRKRSSMLRYTHIVLLNVAIDGACSKHCTLTGYNQTMQTNSRSKWPSGLRRVSTSARLLELRVRNPPGSWIFVSSVLLGIDHYDGPILHLEESYRLWCVIECNLGTSRKRRPWPALGCCVTRERQRMQRKSTDNYKLIRCS